MSKIYDIAILGAGESGVGAALLAQQKGLKPWVSDFGKISGAYKKSLNDASIDWEEGEHNLAYILQCKTVVKSPGIANTTPVMKAVLEARIPVISEIEFAARYTDACLIGITGSNGKTTTTTWIYHMLKQAGLQVEVAGNIGKSLATAVATTNPTHFVIELSSFQLEDIQKFRPHIAVILNITPDHLDRYNHSFEAYRDAKFRITMNQTSQDFLVIDADDSTIKQGLEKHKILAQRCGFTCQNLNTEMAKADHININIKTQNESFMIPIDSLSLKGQHNIKNAMAAATVGKLLNIRKETIRASLQNFQGVSHRLEPVLTIQKVQYINDSKATNVNATYYALDAMKSSVVWIVGGTDKGNDYSELLPLVREKVKAIICLGLDNTKLIDTFSAVTDLMVETYSMSDAVKTAYKIGQEGDVVLLSPACASFDLFENYEDRGNQFKAAVRNL